MDLNDEELKCQCFRHVFHRKGFTGFHFYLSSCVETVDCRALRCFLWYFTDVLVTYTSLRNEASKMGLIINELKTKYVKTSNTTVPHQGADIVNSNCQRFELMEEFVHQTMTRSAAIKRWITATNRWCFNGIQKQLWPKSDQQHPDHNKPIKSFHGLQQLLWLVRLSLRSIRFLSSQ